MFAVNILEYLYKERKLNLKMYQFLKIPHRNTMSLYTSVQC